MDFLTSEEYINLNEVCDLLSISKATAMNWIKNNTLKPIEHEGNKHLFRKKDIETLLADIKDGKISRLKSRRNKNYINGVFIPKTYIQSLKGIEVVKKILYHIKALDLSEGHKRVILAEYALKLLASRKMLTVGCSEKSPIISEENPGCLLTCYLHDKGFVGAYSVLIDDLLEDFYPTEPLIAQLLPALSISVDYIDNQDFLGLLSMSLENTGHRKAKGVYYTPLNVVQDAVDWLKDLLHKNVRLLDPCCGSGNFLMYAYRYVQSLEGLYGYDISSLSICLTRINMALVTKTENIELLYRNFQCFNPLQQKVEAKFDLVIGNPPWGFNYNSREQKALKNNYYSAQTKTVESFCVFTEYALKSVREMGTVCLILPQSLLQVKIHQPIRDFLMKHSKIKRVRYWDNAFDGVQCPSMTLAFVKTTEEFSLRGAEVVTDQRAFKIAQDRQIDRSNWNFNLTDEELAFLNKIESSVEITYLKNQADFALGIVTGDNKKFLSNKKTKEFEEDLTLVLDKQEDNWEPIYRGNDVFKYKCNSPQYSVRFEPDQFQQIAPLELYRAKEKLIYRFIGSSLVFAYDNTQTMTLNSANILIPRIEGLSLKYILAVLNSRVAQYFFTSQFNSIKILRSQIERIPIPIINASLQSQIIAKVDCLIESNDPQEICFLYEEIEAFIRVAFGLSDSEYSFIEQKVSSMNLLLYKSS